MTRLDRRPDVVVVLADDMGFSDLGCYGGEIDTPHLDSLAQEGVRCTQFYNSPRCSPSRASLLTGLHPHQVGIGILTDDDRPEGYPGDLAPACVTMAEVLGDAGYATCLSGKWHVSHEVDTPSQSWPTRRGFHEVYGTLLGAGSYFQPARLIRGEQDASDPSSDPDFYFTDAISSHAADFIEDHHARRAEQPLFLHVAYTAPHWPLHAPEDDVRRYAGRYDAGWDVLRRARLRRLVDAGIIGSDWQLSERDPAIPAWEEVADRDWQARRMEVYAAQVSRLDSGVGRVLDALRRMGRLDNTLFVFLSDNGGCAEELPFDDTFASSRIVPRETRDGLPIRVGNDPDIIPGPEDTYASYGRAWANLSNTPFREYKHWVHEGGISTPMVVHWPEGLAEAPDLCTEPMQLVDVMPTVLEATSAGYPAHRASDPVPPLEGCSMLPALTGDETGEPRTLYWEHEGNAGVRRGRHKLVRKHAQPWELYDMEADRTEGTDVSAERPDLVAELELAYDEWAARCGVLPYGASPGLR